MAHAITPGQKTPELAVTTLHHGQWDLSHIRPKNFTFVVFFRGYHCSICMEYIHDLGSRLDQFRNLGVEVIALSCDTETRAQMTADEWHVGKLPLGYGLSIEQARAWGLYVSRSIQDFEPPIFCEPGMFVVNPDQTLYSAQVQSHPFSRIDLGKVVQDFEYIIERNYPPRGDA